MATNFFKINISGIDEINKRIREETADTVQRKTRYAGRKAMESVRDDAIRRASIVDDPRTPTDISQHVAMTSRYNKRTGELTVSVGIRGKARYRKGDKEAGRVTYWRFVELGTSSSQARPFLRPALANNTNEVLINFIEAMRKQFNAV